MKHKTVTDKQSLKSIGNKSIGNANKSIINEIIKNKALYSMALPGILLLLVFCYFPMFGLIVAFKNFDFKGGIFGSPWANPILQNFQYLFSTNSSALKVTFNTLFLNILFIIFGVIFQVGIAIVFNEINGKYFKKITQTMMFLPHFISWIVVGVISYNLFSVDNGVINSVLQGFGMSKVDWFSVPNKWPVIMVLFYIWKSTGYGMILYLAALSGIDPSYYEAAEMDGANKFQQIKSITIPFLMPTIITLTLLQAGKIMNADFGMFYAIVGDNAAIFPTVDVIDTFVFRSLRLNGDIGMAAAAGFYQSIISFIIILSFNKLSKKLNSDAGLF